MHNRFETKGFLGPYYTNGVLLKNPASLYMKRQASQREIKLKEPSTEVGVLGEGLNKETPTHTGLGDKMANLDVNLGTSTFRVTFQAPMAGKRPSTGSRVGKTSSTASNPVRRAHPKAHGLFSNTKKDKRIIKHSALLSRIEKSKPQSKKRRRPSEKLVANLESLVEALPDAPGPREADNVESANAKIKHQSFKSRPGAMKKKEKIIGMEKDRFNKNMAQMAAAGASDPSQGGDASGVPHTSTKWAALRNFIQQTMEQRQQ
ncbi:MAG: hypothetical protein Q9208_001858 [Pyrenodesmia sp. 3 TL-2023]